MKLIKDSWVLWKQLASLQGSREVYVLFILAKLGSFALGIWVGGSCML